MEGNSVIQDGPIMKYGVDFYLGDKIGGSYEDFLLHLLGICLCPAGEEE